MTTTWIDHVWVAIWALALPLYGSIVQYPKQLARLRANVPGERERMLAETVRWQWAIVAISLVIWIAHGRSLAALGLGAPGGWGFFVGVGAVAVVGALLQAQLATVRKSADAQAHVRAQLERVAPFAPRTAAQARWFFATAVTAGICEEVLMRGYLLAYLQASMSTLAAVIVSAVVFGVAHVYQGFGGVLKTGTVGMIAAGLYLFTGSLWVPMALHVWLDVNAGQLSRAAWRGSSSA